MPKIATVTLVTREGCHLCDAAREVVTAVIRENDSASLVELSIDNDAALADRYAEEIPVILINDRVHNIWRVDPGRFRSALDAATESQAIA